MKRLALSVFALFSSNAATLVGGLLLPITIARTLNETALGIFSSASILGLLVTTVIDWGHETRLPILIPSLSNNVSAIRRTIARVQILKMLLWCIAIVLCAGASGFSLFFSSSTFPSFSDSSLFSCSVLFLLWALGRSQMATYSAVLRGLEQFSIVARVENICSIAMYAMCIVLLFQTQHLALALTVFPCAECLKLLLYSRFLNLHYLNISPPLATEKVGHLKQWRDITGMMREQFPFVFLQGVSIIESRAGMFALGWLALAQSEVGYFGAAMRFVIALRTFSGALFNVVLPSFAKNDFTKNDFARNDAATEANDRDMATTRKNFLRQALFGGGAVAAVGSVCLFILAEALISLIYGAKLLPAVPLLRIVAPLFFLQTLTNTLEAYLLAHKQERFVNVVITVVLVIFFAGIFALHIVAGGVRGDVVAWESLCLSATLLGVYSLKALRI